MTEPKRCKEAGGLEIVTDEAEAFVLIDWKRYAAGEADKDAGSSLPTERGTTDPSRCSDAGGLGEADVDEEGRRDWNM
jgi:hypothetical protein